MINRTPPASPVPTKNTNTTENIRTTTAEDTTTTTTVPTTVIATTSISTSTIATESKTTTDPPIPTNLETLDNLYEILKLRKKTANLKTVNPHKYDSEIQSYISEIYSLIITEQGKSLSFDQVIKLISKTFSGDKSEYRSFRKNIQIAIHIRFFFKRRKEVMCITVQVYYNKEKKVFALS